MATKITTGLIANDAITSAHIGATAITNADLHTNMDLTGKTVLVANASTGDNDTTAANTAFVQQELAALVDSAPGTLNTLNELAAALGDDAAFSTTVTNSIATKMPLAGGTFTGNVNITTETPYLNLTDSSASRTLGVFVDDNNSVLRSSGPLLLQVGSSSAITIDSNKKVGIGTGSPTVLLHIKETGSTSAVNEFLRIENTAGGGLAAGSSINFHHYHAGGGPAGGAKAASITAQNMASWAAGTPSDYSSGLTFGTLHENSFAERMRISSNGHVGIGTTPTSWSSGYISMQIGARGYVGAHTGSDLYLGQNAYFNSGWKYEASVAASLTQHSGGQITHKVAAAGTANNAISWTDALHIKVDGKIGMGTTGPLAQLEIDPPAVDTPIFAIRRQDHATIPLFKFFQDSSVSQGTGHAHMNSGNRDLSITTDTNSTKTNGIYIKTTGQVGIGTTSPSTVMHISGTSDNQLSIDSNSTSANTGIFFKENGNNKGELYWRGASNDFRYYNYNKSQPQFIHTQAGHSIFYGAHQGDSVGTWLFTNQNFGDGTSTNCTLMVKNGNAQVQIMPWSTLGARIGTRGGGWNSNSNNACHLTSGDTANFILNTNGTPTFGNSGTISSDERLKKNITDIEDGQLAKINALKPRNYEWKDPRKAGAKEGFIAQEVESIIPEAVEEYVISPDPDDTSRDFEGDVKVLNHEVMNARLIKAVQELSAELEAAKARITALEG